MYCDTFHSSHIADYVYDFCPPYCPDIYPSVFASDVEHKYYTLFRPMATGVILYFHVLFMRKTTHACPLLASEWYSRWPFWRVVKSSALLWTSLRLIKSHFIPFFLSVLLAFIVRARLLVVFLHCMLRSADILTRVVILRDPCILSTDILDHMHSCGWGYRGTLAY